MFRIVERQFARIVDRRDAQVAPFSSHSSCQGTMLEWCSRAVDNDFIARADMLAAKGLRDQIDRLGRAAHEDDFALDGGVQKSAAP